MLLRTFKPLQVIMWKKLKPQQLLGNAYIRTDYTAKAIVWK